MKLVDHLPAFIRNPRVGILTAVIILLSLIGLGLAFYINLLIGIIMLVLVIVTGIFSVRTLRLLSDETDKYISELSFRIDQAEEDATLSMPIGILIYSEQHRVEWVNPNFQSYFEGQKLLGHPLDEIDEDLAKIIEEHQDDEKVSRVKWNDHVFDISIQKDDRVVYFLDSTKYAKMEEQFDDRQVVIGQIFIDNYDEITQSMADSEVSNLNNFVTNQISSWAQSFGMYLRRVDDDHFFVIMYNETLAKVEEDSFKLLDTIREATSKQNSPVTLSIGIAYGDDNLNKLADVSQSNLDLALGRGGDQVVVKAEDEQARFYGGKTNPMEKRTRVRARMIGQAVQELMNQADQVFVMGHSHADLDSVGSALGIRRIAQMNKKECWIVLDQEGVHSDVARLIEKMDEHEDLKESIISADQAIELANSQSLLVMVDHSKRSITTSEELFDKLSNRVIIIDHHRRGTEFPENPVLVYIEPYASSTGELITEMFEYQSHDGEPIQPIEATAILAGIEVDTKSFTERTGTRTFDAASYLRSVGANEKTIRYLLKENVDSYMQRNHLIDTMQFIEDKYAICTGEDDRMYDPVIAAQAADSLLNISGVEASFVITRRGDHAVGISARSAGTENVQVIMEELGGGGHLAMAATQIEDVSVEEAEQQLIEILQENQKDEE
ncbi:DHH family phosphoesterase [Pediococcus pentosaceus]|uniref:DHH family phosphoesterase n=1 Tax=Pediococcus pentosaceus TaxID=1255 RepID=UPI001F579AEE|nr:DHH family phosphoesterase [Pediococcus pentosaceus]MCI2961400.1 DHH family phosphoesterase [Pediococcus pentosaceus]